MMTPITIPTNDPVERRSDGWLPSVAVGIWVEVAVVVFGTEVDGVDGRPTLVLAVKPPSTEGPVAEGMLPR